MFHPFLPSAPWLCGLERQLGPQRHNLWHGAVDRPYPHAGRWSVRSRDERMSEEQWSPEFLVDRNHQSGLRRTTWSLTPHLQQQIYHQTLCEGGYASTNPPGPRREQSTATAKLSVTRHPRLPEQLVNNQQEWGYFICQFTLVTSGNWDKHKKLLLLCCKWLYLQVNGRIGVWPCQRKVFRRSAQLG